MHILYITKVLMAFYGLLFRQTFYSWGCDATYIDVYGLVLVGVSASLDLCLLLSHFIWLAGLVAVLPFFRPLLALDIGLVLGYLPTAAAPLSFACLLWDESKDFGSHPFVSPLLSLLVLVPGWAACNIQFNSDHPKVKPQPGVHREQELAGSGIAQRNLEKTTCWAIPVFISFPPALPPTLDFLSRVEAQLRDHWLIVAL